MENTSSAIYDADASQRVGLTVKKTAGDGKTRKHKVAHIFRPMSDEDFFKFEEMKRVVQKVSGTDILNVQTEDNNLRASEWLWTQLATARKGYVERDDWKEKTNLLDKQTAIEKGLLAVFVAEEDTGSDPFADDSSELDDADAELSDDELSDDVPTLIKLDCLFNETPITTAHHFSEPSAADVNDYEKTMRKATNRMNARRGFRQKKNAQVSELSIPSKARELCALYDRLIIKSDGYAGRVPAHHKREAILELFSRDSDVTEKN